MTAKIIRHGSRNTYERHGCRCVDCREANARRSQAYRAADPARAASSALADYHKHRAKRLATKHANYDPVKNRARMVARDAIASGTLVKGPCEHVDEEDCLGAIQAHHDDYARPIDVRWLCRRHHMQHHAALNRAIERATVSA